MPTFKNRIADRYGRLLVLEHAGKDYRNKHLWKCLCDCGNEKIVLSDNLSSGKSKSCGCLRKEFLNHSGNQYACYPDRKIAIMRVQYSHLNKRHKKFDGGNILTFESFVEKSNSECKYCGVEFSKELQDTAGHSKKNKRFSDTIVKVNGIDRLNSKIGYTEENTVACCITCNYAKASLSEEQFYIWIKRVYNNLFVMG